MKRWAKDGSISIPINNPKTDYDVVEMYHGSNRCYSKDRQLSSFG